MGGPLVLPELFVLTVDVDPEVLHERQRATSTLSGQQASDIRVFTARVTERGKGAIAMVGPETVNSPAIAGTCGRVRVPELCLEKQPSWRLVTAKIRRDRVCVAGHRPRQTTT